MAEISPKQRDVAFIAVAAGIEVGTGVLLIVRPSLFVWLLFGAEVPPAGDALGRLGGFALLALAISCWPRWQNSAQSIAVLRALLLFSLLTATYLLYLGLGGGSAGPLLWPACAVHAGVAVFLGRGLLSSSPN